MSDDDDLVCPVCAFNGQPKAGAASVACPYCGAGMVRRDRLEAAGSWTSMPMRRLATILLRCTAVLAGIGAALFVAAPMIAIGSLILLGLPAMLFLWLSTLIPVCAAAGGFVAWRSIWLAALLGLPLAVLAALVFSVAGSGSGYMGLPVPLPAAVALGGAGDYSTLLRTHVFPYWPAFAAGVLAGLLTRYVLSVAHKTAPNA